MRYYSQVAELLTQTDNRAAATAYWDSSRVRLEEIVRQQSPDYGVLSGLGTVYARLGLCDSAVQYGRRASELMPLSRDAVDGPTALANLAEIFAIAGERDSAIIYLERVLEVPSAYSVPLLRLDPLYAPLRSHPGFQALLEKYGN